MLSDEQIQVLKSMSLYWKEVMNRDDKSPLEHEAYQLVKTIGSEQLLKIVIAYIDGQNGDL